MGSHSNVSAHFRCYVQGRGQRLKETPDTFSGLFWNGEEAVRQGLADKFGNLDYVAREVIKAEDLVDYTRRENVAERLAKRFGASIGAGAIRALSGAFMSRCLARRMISPLS